MASVVTAVFNYVATALFGSAAVTAGLTVAQTVIAGVITGGIAIGTARAFGSFLKPDIPGIGPNPGTRIQLAPDTGNRIQVIYGDVLTSGPICDAAISNQNETMHFFIVLGEKTDSGTFSLGAQGIRFGDKKLNFGSGASAHIVQSVYDANGTTENNWNGKIRVRIYAGGTASSNQIFPSGVTPVDATTMMPHWTSTATYKATDLVFAMVELDYDAEQGLTNMDAMTFNIVNSLNSPGNVMIDYMTNDRYGAGIPTSLIDVDSFEGAGNSSVGGYADEFVTYTPYGGGSSTVQRYQINGTLSTATDVATNMDKLMMACGSYLLFDGKQGKYKGIPNKVYPDQANCFVANDDNIISSLKVQNTDLYQMYNQVEIEYYDKTRRDQRNSILLETPAGDRNTGEPDNKLSYSIDMINNKVHAEILGNIDLNQTRLDKVVQFTGDHSFIQVDVGDVIKLTNSMYGFTDKLFRVMRIKEKETEDGSLTCEIIALEYSDDVYTGLTTQEDPPFANIGLPRIPTISSIPIPGVFDGSYGNLSLNSAKFGNVIPNETMKVFGAGAQLENAGLSNTTMSSGTTYEDLITPEVYDISGVDIGDYTFTGVGNLGGVLPVGGYDTAFRNNVTIQFANATHSSNQNIGGGGVSFTNIDGAPPQLTDTKKVSLDPTSYSLPADMKPITATARLQGYSTLDDDTANGYPRSIGNMAYEMKRITKGEK